MEQSGAISLLPARPATMSARHHPLLEGASEAVAPSSSSRLITDENATGGADGTGAVSISLSSTLMAALQISANGEDGFAGQNKESSILEDGASATRGPRQSSMGLSAAVPSGQPVTGRTASMGPLQPIVTVDDDNTDHARKHFGSTEPAQSVHVVDVNTRSSLTSNFLGTLPSALSSSAPISMPGMPSAFLNTSPILPGASPGSTLPPNLMLEESPTGNSFMSAAAGFAMHPNSYTGSVSSISSIGGDDEVSTLFVIGFPDDFTEREFQNMFTFASGYESAALKRQERKQGNNTVGQLIGFVKFETRAQAEEARDHLIGRKVDAEQGSTLKAEIAKKNLHTKRGILQDGQASNKPRRRNGYDRPFLANQAASGIPSLHGPVGLGGHTSQSQSQLLQAPQYQQHHQQQQQHHHQQQQQSQQPSHQQQQQLHQQQQHGNAQSSGYASGVAGFPGDRRASIDAVSLHADWRYSGEGLSTTYHAADSAGNAMFDHLLIQSQNLLNSGAERYDSTNFSGQLNLNSARDSRLYSSGSIVSRDGLEDFADSAYADFAPAGGAGRAPSVDGGAAYGLSSAQASAGQSRSSSMGPLSERRFSTPSSFVFSSQDDVGTIYSNSTSDSLGGSAVVATEDHGFLSSGLQSGAPGTSSFSGSSRRKASVSGAGSGASAPLGTFGLASYSGAVAAPLMEPNPFSTTSGQLSFGSTGSSGYSGNTTGLFGGNAFNVSSLQNLATMDAQTMAQLAAVAAAQSAYANAGMPGGVSTGVGGQGVGPGLPNVENAPCNTLYVGNLPHNVVVEELRKLFHAVPGYRRMSFQQKPAGPMCFVEFDDVSSATNAMRQLHGYMLSTSGRSGIRLSYAKNSLGTRSATASDGSNLRR